MLSAWTILALMLFKSILEGSLVENVSMRLLLITMVGGIKKKFQSFNLKFQVFLTTQWLIVGISCLQLFFSIKSNLNWPPQKSLSLSTTISQDWLGCQRLAPRLQCSSLKGKMLTETMLWHISWEKWDAFLSKIQCFHLQEIIIQFPDLLISRTSSTSTSKCVHLRWIVRAWLWWLELWPMVESAPQQARG